MGNENDILTRPLEVEVGIDLLPYLKGEMGNKVSKEIKKMRKRLKEKQGIEMPIVHITDNSELESNLLTIKIFGKEYSSCCVEGEKEFYKILLNALYLAVTNNAGCLSSAFKEVRKNLKKMLKDNSREAYQFLVNYYTYIEPDNKQIFHWLKKLSYFRVPSDLRKLAICYSSGKGCEEDLILYKKFIEKGRTRI